MTMIHFSEEIINRAVSVMRELQAWAERTSGSTTYTANLLISETALQLRLGYIEVWNAEDYSEAELNSEDCKAVYRKEVDDLMALWSDGEST